MTLAYTIENCRNYLTGSAKLSSMVYSDRVAETCEACDRGRTCGVSSFFDGDGVMQKIFLNYDQQIEKLKNEKNLLIDNEVYAKEILKQTSYYSLIGGYKDIFKNPTTKKYKDGTRFEDIVELYYFDELLRQLFLRYLIKVENGIKSQVSYYFTEKNGENQKEYLDTSNYNYSGKKNQRDIGRLIKILEGYVTKPTDYHYLNP